VFELVMLYNYSGSRLLYAYPKFIPKMENNQTKIDRFYSVK
jgi:hypothetical protein